MYGPEILSFFVVRYGRKKRGNAGALSHGRKAFFEQIMDSYSDFYLVGRKDRAISGGVLSIFGHMPGRGCFPACYMVGKRLFHKIGREKMGLVKRRIPAESVNGWKGLAFFLCISGKFPADFVVLLQDFNHSKG